MSKKVAVGQARIRAREDGRQKRLSFFGNIMSVGIYCTLFVYTKVSGNAFVVEEIVRQLSHTVG